MSVSNFTKAVLDIPQLKRGQVWCRHCGSTQKSNSAYALRNGWPKCCGYTMTIDSPEEQAAFKARAAGLIPPTSEE